VAQERYQKKRGGGEAGRSVKHSCFTRFREKRKFWASSLRQGWGVKLGGGGNQRDDASGQKKKTWGGSERCAVYW